MNIKKKRGNPIPLIIEQHPEDYDGYPFITLLKYRESHFLTVVENTLGKIIKAYVLDLCGPENIDEEKLIGIASQWYENSKDQYPISFEFSKYGISNETSKILRTFNVEYITRVIGPLPNFEMNSVQTVKRRQRKSIPVNVKFNH